MKTLYKTSSSLVLLASLSACCVSVPPPSEAPPPSVKPLELAWSCVDLPLLTAFIRPTQALVASYRYASRYLNRRLQLRIFDENPPAWTRPDLHFGMLTVVSAPAVVFALAGKSDGVGLTQWSTVGTRINAARVLVLNDGVTAIKLRVVVHELLHVLGALHSKDRGSIMYRLALPKVPQVLHEALVQRIRATYGRCVEARQS